MNPAVPVLLALAAAGPAPARPADLPDGLAGSRIERGALLALPSVYSVTALGVGARPGSPPRSRSGLAFMVRPDGLLVTALHVLAPPGTDPGGRTSAVTVAQLPPARGGTARTWAARVVATDPDHDLALLRVPVRGAPALVTGGRAGAGTPLAVFESAGGAAAVRTGNAGPTQLFARVLERPATRMRVTVRAGDSGGPAVDGDGRVRGVVVARLDDPGEALLEPPDSVDTLLSRARRPAEEGPSATLFRRGMSELWALRPAAAERDLLAARDAFPTHTLVGRELASADALARGAFRVSARDTGREGLLAAGVAAAVAAACFGLALIVTPGRGRRA